MYGAVDYETDDEYHSYDDSYNDSYDEGSRTTRTTGGFFGQYGREQLGLRPTVIPRYVPPAASPVPASPDEVPEAANEPEAMPDDQSDSSDI